MNFTINFSSFIKTQLLKHEQWNMMKSLLFEAFEIIKMKLSYFMDFANWFKSFNEWNKQNDSLRTSKMKGYWQYM